MEKIYAHLYLIYIEDVQCGTVSCKSTDRWQDDSLILPHVLCWDTQEKNGAL